MLIVPISRSTISNRFLMKILRRNKNKDIRSPERILFDLSNEFKKIEKAYLDDEEVSFTVKKVLYKGVLVQVGSFASYVHRYFFYNTLLNYDIPYWKIISPNLIGKTFKSKIANLNHENFHIKFDSENNVFGAIPLKYDVLYDGIVVLRRKNFIFIDVGYHFKYRYGIHICFIHVSHVDDKDKFHQLKAGDIYPVYYQGYNQSDEIFLSDNNRVFSLDDNEPIEFIRMLKRVSFVKMETDFDNGSLVNLFFELREDGNIVKIICPVNRKYYGRKAIKDIKEVFSDAEVDQEFCCRIVDVDKINKTCIGKVIH